MRTNFTAQNVHNPHAELGEGLCFVETENRLYWNDIHGKKLFVHDLETGLNYEYQTKFKMGWIVKNKGSGFTVGTEDGLKTLCFDPFPTWANLLPDDIDPVRGTKGLRLNDGKADSFGRLWFGTMNDLDHSQPIGKLYMLTPDLELTIADDNYNVPNGPAFLSDGSGFYHNNTAKKTIFKFDLDRQGNLGQKSTWKVLGEDSGYPDGMTIDSENHLWSAEFNGRCVKRYSPEGELVAKIGLPVSQVTNCTFGGPHLSWLFVTCAREHFAAADDHREPLAGSLWVIKDTGCTGLPAMRFG